MILLLTVTSFKYLWWVLTAYDDEWPMVVSNLQKDMSRWARLFRILGWYRSDPWISGTFYKGLVQATLLFVSETWVMTPRIGRILVGFHHLVYYHLAGMNPKRNRPGGGDTHFYTQQCGRWWYSRWWHMSSSATTPQPIILRLILYWIYVWRQNGGWENGCYYGGGSRTR